MVLDGDDNTDGTPRHRADTDPTQSPTRMEFSLRLFFRIVYASIYTFFHILVVALLLVTPADIINQSRKRHDIVPIIIVSVAYVAAILILTFIFLVRLFLNRAVLNSIPKSWIPIGKGDVRKPVRKMIAAGLSRSAAIAFVSRPRIVPDELLEDLYPMLSTPAGTGTGTEGALMSGGVPNKTSGKRAQRASAAKAGGGELSEAEKNNGAAIDDGGDEYYEKENEDKDNNFENPTPTAPESRSVSPGSHRKAVRFKRVETVEKEKELGINLPPCLAVWGEIEHPGWAPPTQSVPGVQRRRIAGSAGGSSGGGEGSGTADLGGGIVAAGALDGEGVNLQYSTIVAELPNLIEAKALTLAPPDPTSQSSPPQLDAEAVALLQRPIYMGLRDYLAHLAELGVLDFTASDSSHGDGRPLDEVLLSFVATYEYARFSTLMLRHKQFRQLMHDLATILRRMTPLDPNLLLDDGSSFVDGDSYSAYAKEGSFVYSDGDSRLFYSGYSGHSQDSTDEDDDDDSDDIDDVGARSSPTTPTRSRSRSYRQQQRVPLPHHSSSAARSQSSASRTSRTSRASSVNDSPGQTGSSSRLPLRTDVDESDMTSRRRHVSRSGALSQPRARPRARDMHQMRQMSSHSSSSAISFARAPNSYTINSQPSRSSLQSAMSAAPSVAPSTASARSASTASDGGSVIIRLADRNEQSHGLPYVLTLPT